MSTTMARTAGPPSRMARVLIVASAGLLLLGAALQAHAQAPAADPPGRVARLSDVSGQVWIYSPDDNEWQTVGSNRPLTTGDRIATDNGARAEVRLGTTTLRLDSATELEFSQVDDSAFHVVLHGGSVAARLRTPQALGEFVLQTDEGRFRVQTVGRFRFDRFDQTSDLSVNAGQAVFEGRNSALPLTTGQHAQFWVDASGAAQYSLVELNRDAFAAWNDDRDHAEDRPVAAVRYVSPEMTGADDLDRYGQWEQTPDYGPLWIPRGVAADWAPYSAGHWAWVRPWGWTWVDDAPWGFAPFHYGRWVYHRAAWCWAPGTYVARPVYAPALVAWIGGARAGVSISIGGGGPPVGWFPLGPHEVYVPSYRTSPGYVRNVNITHVTNITTITTIVNNRNGEADRRDFSNRKFPNAVTVVPTSVMMGRQSVAPAAAQFRGNPQVRELVAEHRPASAMNAAPVAAPVVAARPAESRANVRPPFEGRAPGVAGGRPGGPEVRGGNETRRPEPAARPGDRPVGPGAPPVAGAAPAALPPMGRAPVNVAPPGSPAPLGAPQAGRPVQSLGAPAIVPAEPGRPALGATPNAQTIQRPPRGGLAREPANGSVSPRPMAPAGGELPRPPQAPEVVRPAVQPAEARPAPGSPVVQERLRQERRNTMDERTPPAPPRGAETPRVIAPAAPPRQADQVQRAAEPPKPTPEVKVVRPEAPRVAREPEKRDDKRDDKSR